MSARVFVCMVRITLGLGPTGIECQCNFTLENELHSLLNECQSVQKQPQCEIESVASHATGCAR